MIERRKSLQRQRVLDAITDAGHISAMEIYDKIKPIHSDISVATVYRNIGILLEEQKISGIGMFRQREYYDRRKDSHGHFFCTECGGVYDLELSDIENLLPTASDIAYEIESLQLTCTGVCRSCKSQSNHT